MTAETWGQRVLNTTGPDACVGWNGGTCEMGTGARGEWGAEGQVLDE